MRRTSKCINKYHEADATSAKDVNECERFVVRIGLRLRKFIGTSFVL
jgi:hypothetical protein